jgi:hypothetical protein
MESMNDVPHAAGHQNTTDDSTGVGVGRLISISQSTKPDCNLLWAIMANKRKGQEDRLTAKWAARQGVPKDTGMLLITADESIESPACDRTRWAGFASDRCFQRTFHGSVRECKTLKKHNISQAI